MNNLTQKTTFENIDSTEFSNLLEEVQNILKTERDSGLICNGKVIGELVYLKKPKKLIVVGDLHGDLKTLLKILFKIDYERFLLDPANKMVFLGDYIDRGHYSVEVLNVLFRLKRKFPNSIILMKGNHEVSIKFPFSSHSLPKDLTEKFGKVFGKKIYEKLISIFRELTLITIIENKFIFTHGGIPISVPKTDFQGWIKNIEDYMTDEISEQFLWNDPKPVINSKKDWEDSRRGYGFHFSSKITKKWLEFTGADVLIRGHESCLGFKIDHDGKILTIFSSKEPYPKFSSSFLKISQRELELVSDAYELQAHIHRVD